MFAILVVTVIIVFGAVATVLQSKATTTPTTTTSTSTGASITSQQSNPNNATSSSNSATSQCSEPCALWTRVLGSEVYSDAISSDDSVVAVGTGSGQTSGGIVLFNNQGAVLWNHTVDCTVSSISITPNGSYIAAGGYQNGGLGGAYTNGTVFLFDKAGNLLWNVTGSDPVFEVQFSADGSNLAVQSEEAISYFAINGSQIWNYTTPTGNFFGMDLAADGNYLVASDGYRGGHSGPFGWSFLAFDGQGNLLWNYTAADGEEPDFITLSSNANYTWASSSYGASNASLYLFNRQGNLLWKQQTYSFILLIQAAGNLYANVLTNSGNLIYNATGTLLKNMTTPSSVSTSVTMSSTSSAISTSCAPPSFWTSYWTGPDEAAVAFLDGHGNVVTTYSFAGGVPFARLSTDQLYSVVAGYQNSSVPTSGFSIVFLSIGHGGQSCK